MTPDQLQLILDDSAVINADPDLFATAFYDAVFDISPEVRALFPDDMAEQQSKLVGELRFMIDAAAAWNATGSLDGFVSRTNKLGRRHRDYGVTGAMYPVIGSALVNTLWDLVADFDDDHQAAWERLFGLVSATMLEGASLDQ